MSTLVKKEKFETSLPVYKLFEWKYKDQFWNIIDWKICSCWKLDIKRKMLIYTNYWWPIRKLYICRECVEELWEDHRFNRKKWALNTVHKRNIKGGWIYFETK